MTCETCRFFRTPSGSWGVGECRRNPPQMMPYPLPTDPAITVFPIVDTSTWCGEWMGAPS